MDFSFSRDQLLFQDNVRSFLINEVTPERIRELWLCDSGRSDQLWAQLVESGLTALTVPEAHDGMGMNELDFILLAQECGYAGLPEPLVDTMLIGVPLLAALDERHVALKQHWLGRVAEGRARLAIAEPGNPLVSDAHVADLLLLAHGDEVHAVEPGAVRLTRNVSSIPVVSCFRSTGRQRSPPAWPLVSRAGACGPPRLIVGRWAVPRKCWGWPNAWSTSRWITPLSANSSANRWVRFRPSSI